MTRAKDISKIITDADFSGTLDVTGDLTVVGSSTFDDIKLTAVSLPAAGNPSIALRDTNNIVYHQSGSGNSIVLLDSSQNTMYNASSTSHIFNISNSEKMRIDSSGNVGIGTSSPASDYRASIKGDYSAIIGGIEFDSGGGDKFTIGHASATSPSGKLNVEGAGNLIMNTNNTERMRIDSSGNVGIGTNSPTLGGDYDRVLHLHSTFGTVLKITDATSGTATTDGTDLLNYGNDSYLVNRDAGNFIFGTSGTERVRITSGGNVGIGTSSPSQKLDVNGTIVASTTSSQGARIERNGSTGGANFDSVLSSGSLHFRTGSTERMRILQDGSNRTRVYIDADDPAQNSYFTVSGNNNNHVMLTTNDTSTTGGAAVRFKVNSAVVGQITCSASSTTYSTSSDHRLKENVTADWDATTRLKQLNPVRFNFIADADTTVDGFLAHEVQSVVPEAITGTHNEVDDDGNPVYQGIDQSKLVPLLVKTIQELEARIVALETA